MLTILRSNRQVFYVTGFFNESVSEKKQPTQKGASLGKYHHLLLPSIKLLIRNLTRGYVVKFIILGHLLVLTVSLRFLL